MKKIIIKIVIFFVILTIAFFDYRLLSFKQNRLLVANWHQVESWSEIEQSFSDVDKVEVFPSRLSQRNRSDKVHFVVIYDGSSFYNVKASELELHRIEQLVRLEQVEMVEINPLDAWFYGLLVVLLIMFPVMRKEYY